MEPAKVRTKSGEVRNGTLQFTIRPIQEAVNYKLEKDLVALSERKHPKKKVNLNYVKKDTSRLHGITDGFDL